MVVETNFPIVIDDLVIISGVMTQYGEKTPFPHIALWLLTSEVEQPFGSSARNFVPRNDLLDTISDNFQWQAAMVFGAGDGFIYAIQTVARAR